MNFNGSRKPGASRRGGEPSGGIGATRPGARAVAGPGAGGRGPGTVLEVEAAGFTQTKLGIIEIRVKCDLALNRHNAVISELMSLAAEYPLNENFCALLMRAYYHSGHTVQALEAFRRLRGRAESRAGH